MTLVGTGMDGNAFRAKLLTVQSELDHIRHMPPTRIAQGGHLVDVYT